MAPAPIPPRRREPLEADPQPLPAPTEFEAIFHAYSRYVAAIALRILGRHDEVDDVVQDVFLTAMKGLVELRNAAAVKGWLGTVTVRHASRRLRRRRWWMLLGLSRRSVYENVAAPGSSTEDRVLLRQIYAVLDELPVDQRIAWTLRHVEGEALDTVAQLCDCSLATAKRRIAAAHHVIERMLQHD